MEKKIKILFIINLLILSSFTLIPLDNIKAVNGTIYVDINGTSDYSLIQDAINNSENGTIIRVLNGVYSENLIVDKEIQLIGEDNINTIIDGMNNDVISIITDNVEINGFTIKNGDKGIYISNQSDIIINKNIFMKNEYGVYIEESNNNLIYGNDFIKNNINAYDSSNNIWFYQRTGNFWDDYLGSDDDNDNIGDTSYDISGGSNQDNFPLIDSQISTPIADFIFLPTSAYTYDNIKFNDKSIAGDGEIIEWFWTLGDGNSSNEKNIEHNYSDDKNYNISLEVTDSYGFKDKISKTVIIKNRKPSVDFDYPEEAFARKNILFSDLSEDRDGNIISWKWTFGDGNTSQSEEYGDTTYSYNDDGFYTITLLISDDDGESSIISKDIIIKNNPPTAKIDHNTTIYTNEIVKFTDISTDIDGEIVKREWTLDDGSKSSKKEIFRTYEDAALSKTITLKVWDNDDQSHTATFTFDVISKSDRDLIYGFSPIDIGFFIFIIIMVGLVIFLSRRFGLK